MMVGWPGDTKRINPKDRAVWKGGFASPVFCWKGSTDVAFASGDKDSALLLYQQCPMVVGAPCVTDTFNAPSVRKCAWRETANTWAGLYVQTLISASQWGLHLFRLGSTALEAHSRLGRAGTLQSRGPWSKWRCFSSCKKECAMNTPLWIPVKGAEHLKT